MDEKRTTKTKTGKRRLYANRKYYITSTTTPFILTEAGLRLNGSQSMSTVSTWDILHTQSPSHQYVFDSACFHPFSQDALDAIANENETKAWLLWPVPWWLSRHMLSWWLFMCNVHVPDMQICVLVIQRPKLIHQHSVVNDIFLFPWIQLSKFSMHTCGYYYMLRKKIRIFD